MQNPLQLKLFGDASRQVQLGPAIDTVVFAVTNPGAAPAADNAAAAAGDSKTIRNFNLQTAARIAFLARQGTTAGFVGIKSPRFHDVSRGLQFIVSETPAVKLLPHEVGQSVYAGDTLQVTISGGAAEADGAAIAVYYDDLPGVSAVLKGWADVQPFILNLKPIEVDVTQAGAAFGWADQALTTTENLLKADTYYAILGYTSDTAALAIGIKGIATANLRMCGPGPTSSFATDDYFLEQARDSLKPYIPVVNSNDRAGIFVSVNGLATGGTTKVTLLAAELSSSYHS